MNVSFRIKNFSKFKGNSHVVVTKDSDLYTGVIEIENLCFDWYLENGDVAFCSGDIANGSKLELEVYFLRYDFKDYYDLEIEDAIVVVC